MSKHHRTNYVLIDGSSQLNVTQLCAGVSQPLGVGCAG